MAAFSPGEGKGASFNVTFPLVESGVPDVDMRGTDGLGRNGATLDGLRVLIVDDEADARELLSGC